MNSLTALAETIIVRHGRDLVALVLCPVLLAGCAGTGLQSSGLAGPSWQQREALYFQEDEEEGDIEDRLGEAGERAEANRQRKKGTLILSLIGIGAVAIWLYLGDADDGDEDYVLTFDDSFVSSIVKSPPRANRRWQDTAETAVKTRGVLPQTFGVTLGESRRGTRREAECVPLESGLATAGRSEAASQEDRRGRSVGHRCAGGRENVGRR